MSKHEPGRQLVTQQSYFFACISGNLECAVTCSAKAACASCQHPQKIDIKALPSKKKPKQKKNFELYQVFFFHGATVDTGFAVHTRLTPRLHSKRSGKPHSKVYIFSPPTITANRYLSACYQTPAYVQLYRLKISVYPIWSGGGCCVENTISNDDKCPCNFLNVSIGQTSTD